MRNNESMTSEPAAQPIRFVPPIVRPSVAV